MNATDRTLRSPSAWLSALAAFCCFPSQPFKGVRMSWCDEMSPLDRRVAVAYTVAGSRASHISSVEECFMVFKMLVSSKSDASSAGVSLLLNLSLVSLLRWPTTREQWKNNPPNFSNDECDIDHTSVSRLRLYCTLGLPRSSTRRAPFPSSCENPGLGGSSLRFRQISPDASWLMQARKWYGHCAVNERFAQVGHDIRYGI